MNTQRLRQCALVGVALLASLLAAVASGEIQANGLRLVGHVSS